VRDEEFDSANDKSGRVYGFEIASEDDDADDEPRSLGPCAFCEIRPAVRVARFLQLDRQEYVVAGRLAVCSTCATDLETGNAAAVAATINRSTSNMWPDEPGLAATIIASLREIDG